MAAHNPAEKLQSENIPQTLVDAVQLALNPNGIVVLATCGYYEEDPPPSGLKPFRLRSPALIPGDARYQQNWDDRAFKLALRFQRALFADTSCSQPTLIRQFAGTRRTLSTDAPGAINRPRRGMSPTRKVLP